MNVQSLAWTGAEGWRLAGAPIAASLVIYFGDREVLGSDAWFDELRELFPDAEIMGCSSASQINGNEIVEEGVCAIALSFSSTSIRAEAVGITDAAMSRASGEELGRRLADDDLAGVLVLSDGLHVNGTELTKGISSRIRAGVSISGGLAADGPHFQETLVGLNSKPVSGRIVAVGFYGAGIHLCTGSAGGWAEFGPRRSVTRSDGNVLYALDGKPALDLYELYLGEEDARALPSSALLYPLKIFDPEHPDHSIVRTILSVDRDARSMTFAGDVPQGWKAQLMRGDIDRLSIGAADAARQIKQQRRDVFGETLVLMISCIGRRLLMGQRTIDEVDAVMKELGPGPAQLGFYSYGEICPHEISGASELHNQTMTITAISEAA